MGLSQALYTGMTGLSVNSDGLSVIANNIANANAKGFKRDRAEFEDMVSVSMNSGSGWTQIGRGSRLANIKTMHTQGGLKVTDNLTDLAIQGQGFFVLSPPRSDVQESAGRKFTRVGSLGFDKDGYLATQYNDRVQGYLADARGNLSSRLTDVRIETNTMAPQKTDVLTLNMQLDSRVDLIKKDWNMTNPDATSNFSSTVSIFDSHGDAHQATLHFRKTAASPEGTEWDWFALADNGELLEPASDGNMTQFANGSLRFNKDGLLLEEVLDNSSVSFSNGSDPEQKIDFDFGFNIGDEQGTGINSSTSIAGDSLAVFHQQDGYEAGQLKSVEIGQDGVVKGTFSNGIERKLAAFALATFPNQDGLKKAGHNQFFASISSGPAIIGLPQSGLRGTLFSSTLEESNVDLAQEFVNMITTQRLFQANSRSLTTFDTMIEEVINLKR